MTSEFDQHLDRLAEVSVKIGLNLQPGQRLLIGTPLFNSLIPVETAPLVRRIAVHAYKAGARLVDVLWDDDQLKLTRLREAPSDSFEEFPDWQINTVVDYLERKDALLGIYGHDPNLFDREDSTRLGRLEQVNSVKTAPIMEYIATNATNWLIIPAVVSGWAARVFPDAPPEEQDDRLWDAIFNVCRVKHPDPIAGWREHIRGMNLRGAYLDQKQYSSLHYTSPGTDFTVGLPPGHIWTSAAMKNASGIQFTANIPTEEVFTLPDRLQAEGTIKAAKPLSFGGGLVEDFSLTFSGGRVVKIAARKGEENLRMLIETDEGACRLGEVALVPHSSPISQSGLTFSNILIDENASSHLALGHAYKFTFAGGEQLSDAAFAAAGGNLSSIHIDFMVGSGEMNVDGLQDNSAPEPIMRNGEWAFEV